MNDGEHVWKIRVKVNLHAGMSGVEKFCHTLLVTPGEGCEQWICSDEVSDQCLGD